MRNKNYLDSNVVVQGHYVQELELIQNVIDLYSPYDMEFKLASYLKRVISTSQEFDNDNFMLLQRMYEERLAAMSLLRDANANYYITITPVSNLERSVLHDFTNKLIRRTNRTLFGRNYFKNGNGFLKGLVIFENAAASHNRVQYSSRRNTLPHNHYHCFVHTDRSHEDISVAFLHGAKSIKMKGNPVFNVELGIDIQDNDNSDKLLLYSTKECKNSDNIFPLTVDGISPEDKYYDQYRAIYG